MYKIRQKREHKIHCQLKTDIQSANSKLTSVLTVETSLVQTLNKGFFLCLPILIQGQWSRENRTNVIFCNKWKSKQPQETVPPHSLMQPEVKDYTRHSICILFLCRVLLCLNERCILSIIKFSTWDNAILVL